MNTRIKCLVCSNVEGGSFQRRSPGFFECEICGTYTATEELWSQIYDGIYDSCQWNLNPSQRAGLSHHIRKKWDASSQTKGDPFEITSDVLDSFRSIRSLPSPDKQAANIVRFIGDEVSRSGEAVGQLPINFHAIIGALNREAANRLTEELVERKILKADPPGTAVGTDSAGRPLRLLTKIDLSLDGWKQYKSEKRGQSGGNYDFLERAQQLLDEGDKDPAAVMAGIALEKHLRQLCQKHDIPTETTKQGRPYSKKADTLNAELVKKKVYNQLDQKQVTTWLDLRNKAAHGKYQEYTKEQVSLMLQGLPDFMVRVTPYPQEE